METPDNSLEETPIEDRPVAPRRRRGGGVSAESLLASVLLHLAVLFLVIFFAADGKKREHDAVLVDIGQFVLPESSAPAPSTPAPAPAETEAPEAAQPAAGAAVEIPSKEAEAKAEEPPKADEEPPAPEAAKADPPPPEPPPPAPAAPAETAKAAAPTPPVPETSLPHGHGAYDPFEVYKAALAERVNKVLLSVAKTSSVLRALRGRLVVHLYLDPQGRPRWFTDQAGLYIRGAAICLHHKGYTVEPVIPMNEPTFMWHTETLDAEVVKAVNDAGPYPAAPPGLTIPDELSYVFTIPDSGFRHPPLPPAPAAGPPQGPPQG